jgi:6-phosphogluconolactonase (cycloisomerase 2 family)
MLLAAAVALGPGAAVAEANGGGGPKPKVVGTAYTQTNDPAGNRLIVFARLSDGTLKQVQTVKTGGLGGQQDQPGCPGACPILDTQGEIASTPDEHLVFAVNAGSDSITSFLQTPFGLIPIDRISSGGDFPNSLTVHGNTLYVLNSNSGTIKGFKFGPLGFMVPIPGSTQSLVGNPPPESTVNARQIGFDNTGRVLVVSVLGGNMIETFKVDAFGRAGPIANSRAPQQPLPFGFAFDPKNRLVMSEVTSLTAFGNVSTYSLNTNTAALSNIDSEPTGAAAPCWVVVTKDGRYTFVVNTGGGAPADISRYRLGNDGSLTSLGANTGPNGAEFARTDEDLSRDSRFLYVLNPGIFAGDVSKIDEYKVGNDGSLTLIGATPANLPAGISGLIVH